MSQDYNAAANVELTVDLPEEAFDAYYVKLRPELKDYVNSVTVYRKDGSSYKIPGTDWQGNGDKK